MQTKEWSWVDKSQWQHRGPWDNEPDKMQWVDEATGLPCLIVRHPNLGHLCGYVGVSAGYPLFEKHYNDVETSIEVHWGLTYSDHCDPPSEDGRPGICHEVCPGEDDNVWWLGFDCAHWDDLSPGSSTSDPMFYATEYRDIGFVRAECASLARQLCEIAKQPA